MKRFALILLAISAVAHAEDTIKFSFKDADIHQVIEEYAKVSGKKIIVDPAAHGKVTIYNPQPVSVEEAFNQLSSALAVNGLGIVNQDGQLVVMSARAIQRDDIEVSRDLPALKPERMATWVVSFKNINADDINRELRILTSRDGELVPYTATNQLVITDWTSNLHRVAKILAELDHPVAPGSIPSARPHPPRPPHPIEPPHFKSKGS